MTDTVYRDGSKLVRLTGESPPQFEGVLFVVYEGDSPETVGEALRSPNQLQGLDEVDTTTLSNEWLEALGLPKVDVCPKHVDAPDSQTVMRGGGQVAPTIKVIETRYVTVNPRFGWFCLNFFLGLGFLVTLFQGLNAPFIFIIVLMSFVAVVYAWAATYVNGRVGYERP